MFQALPSSVRSLLRLAIHPSRLQRCSYGPFPHSSRDESPHASVILRTVSLCSAHSFTTRQHLQSSSVATRTLSTIISTQVGFNAAVPEPACVFKHTRSFLQETNSFTILGLHPALATYFHFLFLTHRSLLTSLSLSSPPSLQCSHSHILLHITLASNHTTLHK